MKRKLMPLSLATALILPLLAGCIGKAGPAKGETLVNFWHVYDSGIQKDAIDKVVADFNAAQKGKIRVEALAINFWDYWDKLSVSMAAGQEPDVFFNDLGNVGARAKTGVLLDLTPQFAAKGVDFGGSFIPQVGEMCSWDGKIYAFPFEPDVRLLFYNKTLLKEAGYDFEANPPDWNTIWEAGKKLTTHDAQGNIDRLGINAVVAMSQSYFWTWVWGNGHDFRKDGKLAVNAPEVVADLASWKGMIDQYGKEKLDKFGADFGAGAADPFIVGKLAMSIHGNAFYGQIERFGKTLDWGVMLIPYPKVTVTWSNGFSVELSARGKAPEASFEFARWLLSKDVQVRLGKDLRMLTASVEAQASPELSSDPFMKLCAEALAVTKFRDFVIESPKWYEHMMKGVERVEHGIQKPKQSFDEVQDLIEADFQKFALTNK